MTLEISRVRPFVRFSNLVTTRVAARLVRKELDFLQKQYRRQTFSDVLDRVNSDSTSMVRIIADYGTWEGCVYEFDAQTSQQSSERRTAIVRKSWWCFLLWHWRFGPSRILDGYLSCWQVEGLPCWSIRVRKSVKNGRSCATTSFGFTRRQCAIT